MSFTAHERRYLDIGLPCPMSWSMALAYARLLVGRDLSYADCLEILGLRPDIEHPYIREWLQKS